MSTSTLTQQQLFRRQAAGDPILTESREAVRQHLITVTLENSIGALNRVVNMFSQRGFNLESVSVGETLSSDVSRMTLVTTGNTRTIAQVLRQLENLVDTLEIENVTNEPHVERELCLLRVEATTRNRTELTGIADVFRGKVVNITPDSMTFEVSGPPGKIDGFIGMMKEFNVLEVARSGRVCMHRNLPFEPANSTE
jgi:acetolactate synthase I/III small subunit